MITLTDADILGMLRRVYNAFENEIFPVVTPLQAQIEKAGPKSRHNIKWGGENAFFPVTIGRPLGLVADSNGWLPEDHEALERQASEGVKRLYIRRQVDGLAITGTTSKEAAFRPLARKIVKEATIATKLGVQELLHGDGLGIKATVTTFGTTTCVVQNPYGISGAGRGGLLLDKGQIVQFQPAGGGTARVVTNGPGNNTVKILAVTHVGDAATLTFDTSASVAAMANTDEVIGANLQTALGSRGMYPNGLTNICRRAALAAYNVLHNIDPTVAGNGRWDAVRMVAGTDTQGLTAIEMDIWELAQRVAGRSGHSAIENPEEFILVGTPGIERQLAESLIGQRTFTVTDKLKGGYKALEICGMPFIKDFWCPVGTLYLIHLPSIFKINAKDFGYVVLNGAGPWRFVVNRDAYETSWGAYINYGTTDRAAHGMITGFTDTNRYDFTIA